jgi:hypothetical protein
MLSTKTRLRFTSGTVSSEHPRIRSGFTAVRKTFAPASIRPPTGEQIGRHVRERPATT